MSVLSTRELRAKGGYSSVHVKDGGLPFFLSFIYQRTLRRKQKILKFVKLLKIKSKSWFQIVDVPILLSKFQTQTWKVLKFVKLFKIKSKS